VRRITDREPGRGRKARAVVQQAGPNLILTIGETELHLHHNRPSGVEPIEYEMGVVFGHWDSVRVEVETRSVAWLSSGSVVGDVDGVIVVDQGLHTLGAHQRGGGADAEVAVVCGGRRPVRQVT